MNDMVNGGYKKLSFNTLVQGTLLDTFLFLNNQIK